VNEKRLMSGAEIAGEREVVVEVPGVKEWVGQVMEESLSKLSLDQPCKISLGLDVLDTPTTRRKITCLVEMLSSECLGSGHRERYYSGECALVGGDYMVYIYVSICLCAIWVGDIYTVVVALVLYDVLTSSGAILGQCALQVF